MCTTILMIYRSEPYKEFIREHQCLMLDGTCKGDVVSHHEPMGQAGVAIKAMDSLCVPLCRKHHDERHSKGKHVLNSYDIPLVIIKYLTEYLERNGL